MFNQGTVQFTEKKLVSKILGGLLTPAPA